MPFVSSSAARARETLGWPTIARGRLGHLHRADELHRVRHLQAQIAVSIAAFGRLWYEEVRASWVNTYPRERITLALNDAPADQGRTVLAVGFEKE